MAPGNRSHFHSHDSLACPILLSSQSPRVPPPDIPEPASASPASKPLNPQLQEVPCTSSSEPPATPEALSQTNFLPMEKRCESSAEMPVILRPLLPRVLNPSPPTSPIKARSRKPSPGPKRFMS